MDWTTPLRFLQADFHKRLKKQKSIEPTLLNSDVRGCHSEMMTIFGEQLDNIRELCHQKAEDLAQYPPPIPPNYDNLVYSFQEKFEYEASEFFVREQLVHHLMMARLGKLVKKVKTEEGSEIELDDEGNLRNASKFTYTLSPDPSIHIQVNVCDGESFNSFKKEKVKWSVTEDDINNHQAILFVALFWLSCTPRGYEKECIFVGFLPSDRIEIVGPKANLGPSDFLYAGGLRYYLESLIFPDTPVPAAVEQVLIAQTPATLNAEAPLVQAGHSWECSQTLKKHKGAINTLAISPDGQTLASGSYGETYLWHLPTGDFICTLAEHPWVESWKVDEVSSLSFSSDGYTLASGNWNAKVTLWHIGAREMIYVFPEHDATVRCVAFSADGRTLASGGDDRKIKLWDMHEQDSYSTIPWLTGAAHSLAFSPDNQLLASGSYRKLKVWSLELNEWSNSVEGRLLNTIGGHSHVVSSVSFTPNSRILVSGSLDKTIKLWNPRTGKLIHTFKGHEDSVFSVAVSPNGEWIASGSGDRTVKLWHLQTGELLATFIGHEDAVKTVAFSPDGQRIVSGSLDKTLKIWSFNP